ncbi:hypothetical protein O6H91_18G016400 [Diphasiastrum complanatum]|uniref:Uncharacterized protein n=4 Tax=Diphasiastrum complanatum TaxID=34168 RepID=A0ACC2AZP1_DIPCM|nr:hypothetical protein O6H91_18G016400 [Diphasiastrum complanatum]KAJ7522547.1 hypothetical protein O6H91_18G016400 [Diphasiastrum complanatum]KAJ7522548.1 hypothetical protein O6H91_18G016400 [Diphasiastrum complanatum]KAJ7522549.1 hypothetical protein O6H91_18G016400 [Diphasiastrum complanatum]
MTNSRKLPFCKATMISRCVAAVAFCYLFYAIVVAAKTDPADYSALQAFHNGVSDPFHRLSNWQGDPCDDSWEGVFCASDANNLFHVTELRLLNHNLSGTLAPELGNLLNLNALDLMWNNFSGNIPSTLGNVLSLTLLLLNGNILSGKVPTEIGNLINLVRFQIDENQLSGQIPPTLGNLYNVQHLHMNNNSLNGSIPHELGRLQKAIHLLLDNNNLSGALPSELSNISTLRILQLDNNPFNPQPIPLQYGEMSSLVKLSLKNCNLQGSLLNLGRLQALQYLDLSNNQLDGTIQGSPFPPNISVIVLSNNKLTGDTSHFDTFENLQALILENNQLNGSVPVSLASASRFGSTQDNLLLDFQNNTISNVSSNLTSQVHGFTKLWLYGNPVICGSPPVELRQFCVPNTIVSVPDNVPDNSVTSCQAAACNPGIDELIPPLSARGICLCASPIKMRIRLKTPGFIFFDSYLTKFETFLSVGANLTLDQVFVASRKWEGSRLVMDIKLFPTISNAGNRSFNSSELRRIYDVFSRFQIPTDPTFGPYDLISFDFPFGTQPFSSQGSSGSLSKGAIAGIILGCAFGTSVAVAVGMFLLMRRRRLPKSAVNIFGRNADHGNIKISGVKYFTMEELLSATDSFSESHCIGRGGYGKVYKGVFKDGQVVAIKCAQEGSLQGFNEFHTEIELLSRVHHRNLVSLMGYCNDDGQQILVYEFISGGTLRDNLSPDLEEPLDFPTRIQVALGSARGILYLHTEAYPPIFHRDIKASNILLDEHKVAKVADFGLSKLAPTCEVDGSTPDHVSTVVKGTPGYLDPQYFLTRQLTDKSDVYSFGVVLLELITGMYPISQGKNLVREVNLTLVGGRFLSMVDSTMGPYPSEALERSLRLALACSSQELVDRPSMVDVVRELEDIQRSTPWMKSKAADSDYASDTDTKIFLSQKYLESSNDIWHVAPR